MGILNQPDDWCESGTPSASPPRWYEALEADGRFQFYNDSYTWGGGTHTPMDYTGTFPIEETDLVIDWEVLEPRGFGSFTIRCQFGATVVNNVIPGTVLGSGQVVVPVPPSATSLTLTVLTDGLPTIYNGVLAITTPPPPPPPVFYNCECEDERLEETLAVLRTRLMRRLGFSAQVANPPPGMAELLDDFLRDAQAQLYRRFDALRTERYFRWTMQPGVRYYGILNSDQEFEADGTTPCTLKLDAHKITWVGIENYASLIKGIPASVYLLPYRNSLPSLYEVRQCIEVWPPPDRDYVLRVRGHFGLQRFTDDDDQTTFDSNAIFLYALGLAKAHYGQPEAGNYIGQALTYCGALVAGAHHTSRYVPGTTPPDPLVQPRMDKWDYEP
jgi:hypothetical protein